MLLRVSWATSALGVMWFPESGLGFSKTQLPRLQSESKLAKVKIRRE